MFNFAGKDSSSLKSDINLRKPMIGSTQYSIDSLIKLQVTLSNLQLF